MNTVPATENEIVLREIKKVLATLRKFEEDDPTLDDGERIDMSKGTDQIELVMKSYADRNQICYKHGEGFVTSGKDGKYCLACQRES